MPLRKLQDLFSSPTIRDVRAGQIILHQGDPLNSIYLINKGYVKMYVINDEGEERDLLIFPPNTAFPIYSTFSSNKKETLEYFYEAITDCRIMIVPVDSFISLIKHNIEASHLVLDYISGLSSELVKRISIIENKEAVNKIQHLLEYLSRICSQEIKPGVYKTLIKITQQDIANLAGMTRETASIQLKKLKDSGVVEQKANMLVIHSRKLSKR